MSTSFENKKVIIAGGNSGIGLETARLLAAAKATVVVTGRDKDKLYKAVEEVPGIQALPVDGTDPARLKVFFGQQGPFDHLVITLSGGKGMGVFREMDLHELREAFDKKFWAYLYTVQAALPYLNKGGSITLVTAISSQAKMPGTSGLAAVNGALELMVPIWARENPSIRINAVSPGVIDTPWWSFLPEAARLETFAQFGKKISLGRVGKPEEIAHAIAFLAANTYTTGKVIACDGGMA